MDGVHDMGGMHGFGPLAIVAEEPKFRAPWEGRVFAMNLAMAIHTGANTDRFRFLLESMPPAHYLNASYYERWLHGLLQRCREHGLLSEAEMADIAVATVADVVAGGHASSVAAERMRALLMHHEPAAAVVESGHEYQCGDRVRARNIHPAGHTRMPRYVRGKRGCVIADNGKQLFADDSGSLRGRQEQTLYTVEFSATELWGSEANAADCVCLDLWAAHLELA